MPIYEYRCRKCGHEFEHLARRLTEVAPPCPKCGADRPVKRLSVFSAGTPAAPSICSEAGCPASALCRERGGCPGGACHLGDD